MITMKDIKIIDMPMGEGKTTGLINYMNNHPDNKYLFITPFLDEVERIQKGCKNLDFKTPDDKYSKLSDLKKLIDNGENIASTHALFSIIDKETRNLIRENGYILVLDEVLEVVSSLEMSRSDLDILKETIISVAEDGLTSVVNKSYEGNKFKREVNSIKNKSVYLVDGTFLLCLFNPEVFEYFDDVIVLTYLFDGSIMKSYFDLYHLDYNYYQIIDNDIVSGKFDDSEFRKEVKKLVNVYQGKLNDIGENETALCSNWYSDKKRKSAHIKLKNNMYNYLKNIVKSNSKEAMWTTFIGDNDKFKDFFTPKSYKINCFVSCNMRATNKFAHKVNLVYSVNVFLNPFVIKYFNRNKIKLNENNYALSQLLQWIWRSRIRNGEEINIYIPSRRMRELFFRYLDNKEIN